MSMKTIVALYEHRRDAVWAVRGLLTHGISKDRISLVSKAAISDAGRIHLPLDEDPTGSRGPTAGASAAAEDATDAPITSPTATMGATVAFASVLLGVAFLSVPAIGPVLAAGPLLAGIAGSGAGVGSLDLPQRLTQCGMPPADAERHTRAVGRGGVLVVLTVNPEDVEDAAIILARHRPVAPEHLHDRPLGTTTGAMVQAPLQPPAGAPKASTAGHNRDLSA